MAVFVDMVVVGFSVEFGGDGAGRGVKHVVPTGLSLRRPFCLGPSEAAFTVRRDGHWK